MTAELTRSRSRRVSAPMTVLAVASAGVFLSFVDATIVNVVFPDIRRSYPDASIGGLSWIFNAYNIVFAAFLVAAGRVADLLGRRRVFCGGIALFTFGSLLCALAPSLELLVAARVVQAAGAATVVPASLAIVLEAFPPSERARGVALWAAAASLAAGVGPALGGVLVELGNWRLAFLVNLPLGVLAMVAARRTLVESRAPGRRRTPDIAGSFLLALAIGALTLGIVKGEDWGWASAPVLGSLVAAALLGAWFVARCTRHRAPVIDLDLLRIRTLSLANGLTLLAGAAYFSYILCNILYLTSIWGYSVLEAGLAGTPGPVVAAAVAGAAGRVSERHGYRVLLVPGAIVWAAGLLYLVTQMGPEPAFLSEWLPATVLLGAGAGAAFPALSGAAISSAPGTRFATATALNSVSRQLGAVLGVAILVTIVGTPAPADAAAALDRGWIFGAILLLVVAVGSFWVGRVPAGDGGPAEEEEPPPRRVVRARPPAVSAGAGAAARVSAFLTEASAPAREHEADFLARVPVFAQLSAEMRSRIAERARTVHLAAGEWLVRRGDPAETLYVVRSGGLDEVRDATGGGSTSRNGGSGQAATSARLLGQGAVVGELAVVSSSKHAVSLRARRDSQLLAIERESIDELLHEQPDFALSLVRVLGDQLGDSREAVPRPRSSPATIALVPLEPGLPTVELANRLADSLARLGSIAILDGSERGPANGDDPLAVYGPLLARCERDHERTLLVTGSPADRDHWTDICLRQADRVLALSWGGPVPGWVERSAGLRGCDLVCHLDGDGPRDWSPWVEALAPAAHHRLSGAALTSDLERMARRLAGRSLGIVLSGGGARALAHLGVIEELLGAGIEIDRVGGSSMGSYIGGLLALGMEPAEIDACCYEEWVRRNPINDYTLPRTALIRSRKMESMLRHVFGDVVAEEAERDFYCVSADLRAQELVVHRHGPLDLSVGASLCLPVVAAPRVRGRRLLVDGGVLNNLPVDVMRATGEGPIIAVDVKPARERRASSNGAPARAPGLLETLVRVMLIGSANTSAEARAHADVVIAPRVEGVGLLEFHQIDQAREAGRRAALEALERQAPRSASSSLSPNPLERGRAT